MTVGIDINDKLLERGNSITINLEFGRESIMFLLERRDVMLGLRLKRELLQL